MDTLVVAAASSRSFAAVDVTIANAPRVPVGSVWICEARRNTQGAGT
jgi:hypothetical protein